MHPRVVPAALREQSGLAALVRRTGASSRISTACCGRSAAMRMSPISILSAAGVGLDAANFVATDGFQNTNVPGVYAIGDVTGRDQLDARGDCRRQKTQRSPVRRPGDAPPGLPHDSHGRVHAPAGRHRGLDREPGTREVRRRGQGLCCRLHAHVSRTDGAQNPHRHEAGLCGARGEDRRLSRHRRRRR